MIKVIMLVLLYIYSGITMSNVCDIKYINNYDGDTVKVKIKDLQCLSPYVTIMNIRINGVDTPEIHGKCKKEKRLARKVKYFVRRRLKHVDKVIIYGKDKYFRLIGDYVVTYYGKKWLLSDLLIHKGYGVKYNGGHKNKDWCK